MALLLSISIAMYACADSLCHADGDTLRCCARLSCQCASGLPAVLHRLPWSMHGWRSMHLQPWLVRRRMQHDVLLWHHTRAPV